MTKDEPLAASDGSFLGSGMSMVVYGLLLLGSVGLFVLWGGPLWTVTHTQSHVMRFVVSYLSVVPASAIILLLLKRFTWTHWLTAVGTLWAIKLLLTAPLYYALAPGGALEDIGAIAPKRGGTPTAAKDQTSDEVTGYQAARGDFAKGSITGTVTHGGATAEGAVVYLERPTAGRPLGTSKTITMVMTETGYEQPLYVATTQDKLLIRNDGNSMNNAHLRGPSASLFNAPLPPGQTSQPLAIEEPNLYTMRSDTASNVRAALLVLDHPYAARVDDAGTFSLSQVPATEARVVALWADDEGNVQRAERTAKVTSGEELRVDLSIAGADPRTEETK
jgi:hypothetical protein